MEPNVVGRLQVRLDLMECCSRSLQFECVKVLHYNLLIFFIMYGRLEWKRMFKARVRELYGVKNGLD